MLVLAVKGRLRAANLRRPVRIGTGKLGLEIGLLLRLERETALPRRLLGLGRPTQPTQRRNLAEGLNLLWRERTTDNGLGVSEVYALRSQGFDLIELLGH
ncbi:MAG: hypothetical protein IKC80_09995 [Kiritimatiellae bacterium]|nr:hypothetical protein [Kiritimatiellia bacterium]